MENKIERAIKVYGYQCDNLNDIRIAFNSLSSEFQELIKKHRPEILQDIEHKNRLEVINRSKIDKRKYYVLCRRITELNAPEIEGIEKRAYRMYDIDHIVPISYGYKHSIPYWLIGSIENLRVISNKDNFDKNKKITEDSIKVLSTWEENGYI